MRELSLQHISISPELNADAKSNRYQCLLNPELNPTIVLVIIPYDYSVLKNPKILSSTYGINWHKRTYGIL